jgi:predicted  nucleic acid-binding Zn-ribbon protein
MGFSIKIIALGVFIVLLSLPAGGYVWWTQNELGNLHNQLEVQIVKAAEQDKTIEDYKKQMILNQQLNDNYNQELSKIRTQSTQLRDQIDKLNLQLQAAADPREVEKLINSRFQDTFKELRALNHTGGK